MKIQCFKNMYSQNEPYSIELLEWLTSERFKEKVELLRAAPDKATEQRLKDSLPCAMPSLLVDGTHSGLIAVDVDAKDNPDYSPQQLKEKVCSIANVYYCGYSCRGKGVFALIPLSDTTKHVEHFTALIERFKNIGIAIDEGCSNVNRLRYASYDAEPYFNNDAIPFRLVPEPKIAEPKINVSAPDFEKGKNIFAEFNQKGDVIQLLKNHGWSVLREKSDRIFLTRPDKVGGISGEFSPSRRLFHCYTNSAQFEAKKAYNAVQLLGILECNEDKKRIAETIKQLIK